MGRQLQRLLYELETGDSFGFCYHRHHTQEEVFYVQAGTATFETADGDVEVTAGEAVRFPPMEFQRGTNRGEERVVALALSAPRGPETVDLLRTCPTCGERTPQDVAWNDESSAIVATCEACGSETGRFE